MVPVVDLSLFSAERLAHPVGLADALRHLEPLVVSNTDDAVAQIVRELLSVPGLFCFLISAWPNSRKLVERIFSAFPKEPALIPQSFVKDLLFKISHTLFSIPPDLLTTDLSKNIGQFRQYVDNVLPVLAMLCCADFASETSITEGRAELVDEDIPFYKQKVKKQRRKVKQAAAAVDPALFFKLGVPVPTTNEGARRMANDIAEKLKLDLDFYLSALSSPELAMPLKNAYVQHLSDHSTSERLRTVVEPSTSVAVETQPSAYPTVQPMKAALYFDNADGFGEWRVLIGTDVTKKLTEFRENDRQKFKIVVKKIKELSHGRFSDGNQKRLDGARSGVPIFEAKMQQDLKLVYQIDCVPDHEGEIERQVIRIFEICTHTQPNRIWNAMNHHLSGKGKEYIQRCTYRNSPVHPGDRVYLPAVFPPEVHDVVVKPPPLVLGDKEMDQLHSLLVLEKYITFSQALINGIIARKIVQHVFELTPPERKIVDCTTSCYVLGRSGTGKTTTMLFKMLGIQRAWQLQSESSGMPRPRQIFVTKSPVLANKVEEYFVKLLESLSLAGYTLEELARLQPRNMDLELVDTDDVPDAQSGIPQRYSELEDHHFPLFLTFDRLARMIAADILEADHPEAKRIAKLFMRSQDPEVLDSFVSYDTFANTYWPHFPQPLTKGLDPWLVFGEIVGIIKGSEKSLGFDDGILDKKTYCGLPSRSNPTFSGQRELVYALFEAYSKLKRQRQHHDIADRTHAVLKTLLGATSLKGRQVDYLYVDEAQDNLLIDALLLRLICSNPEGLFWAGDTAQTISAGSSFRFDDLKAFLHRIEVDQASHMVRERRVAPPMSFQLAINYRSHGGIVNCAHSVIELISRFWPNSIDSLQPEHGIVDGLKPVFFTGWDKDTIGYEQFLFGTSGSHIEFGAQQCILVRNEKAREKLRQQVGDIGLIMTLYESKGLEFNDVLLYNFFEDSNVDLSRWRLVLAAIDSGFDGHSPCRLQAPCFERDESRYAGVCGELKLLYVGITRARKNMWIVDKSDKAEPMRIFWTSRSQIQNCSPGTDAPHLAVSSTPEEWAESGRLLFHHKRYTQAMHCFGRAEMPREMRITEAYHFRELARATVGVALASEQRQAFAKAADAFDKCGSEAPGRQKLQYYHTAAECYVRAADDRKAADAYLNAEVYELAAKHYRKAGIFDKTVDVLESYSKKISPDCADELLTVCRLYYCSKDDEKPPSSLFSSFEEELDFLETYGLDVALVVLYESHGKYVEAAELHLSEDKPLDAIGVLLKDKTNEHAMRRAADILLDCLWKHCSFGVSPKEFYAGIPKTLISFSHQLPLNLLSPRARDEIKMFQTAAAEEPDRVALETLAESFIEQKDNAAALWCLNHVFSRLPPVEELVKLEDFTLFLRKFYTYSHLLYTVASHNDPVGGHGIRKLFAITQLSDDQYDVQAGSFILATPSAVSTSNDEQTNASPYTHGQITNALKDRVRSYLRHQVDTETRLCYSAKIFSQCLLYSVIGSCKYGKCKQQHVSLSSLDSTQYNARVGIHLQQMRILQLVYSAFPEMREQDSVKGEIADWIAHLYEAFFPPFRAQGSLADLKWSSIQGASDGIRVVRHWVRDAIYALEPRYSADFLTDILRLIKLSSVFGESDALQNANCVRRYRPRAFFRYPGRYIVQDMIESNQSATEASIFVGILGLRHAIRTNIQVNLSVLCDCIEEVFSAFVITLRLKNNPGADSLHDVVLPRSWLIRNNKLDARKDVTNINYFLDDIQYLLEELRSDSTEEHLWLLHTNVTPVHRSIFIARICRMLSLASYNCPPRWVDLKGRISSIINNLRSNDPARPTPYIYRHYAQTPRDNYLHVIVAYDENHAIPNLVHLRCKGHATSLETSRLVTGSRIQELHYSRLDEIPTLLASPLIVARSQLRVEAPVFVPRAGISLQTKPAEDHLNLCLEIDSAQLDKPIGDVGGPPLDDDQAAPAVVGTDEEESAAGLIQRVYRQHREKQRRLLERPTLEAERSAIYATCLKHAQVTGFAPGFYRLLYLGPLPHLLLGLKKGIIMATFVRNTTKIPGLLLKEGHERLEELGRNRSEISWTLKQGHELLKKLSPDSQFHKNRDIGALKDAVLQVKEFLHRIPGGARGSPEELNIAYKAIVAEKHVPKKEKPSLNVEDLDPYEY
ncbi:hypothetical protein M404DRAFT_380086 [Pisolithus tinctorius Marx 270]|uniref:UvrD-like helicase ATP-binding domain-containing protein n=1 Tax=Pisolithus tinctorius Marx 270 TaxID=870435 RepID=A0A0C3IBV7_PISTI|nr:hypothetical protein M404DRAFT_380086 [Pisolithus tinctorius Marx 270]